jgi:hypothetical protein
MRSGTNKFKSSACYHNRSPHFNAFGDPTVPRIAGANELENRGTDLKMFGGTLGGPIVKNRYIVTENPAGRRAVSILDPAEMPERPFPLVVVRKSKAQRERDDDNEILGAYVARPAPPSIHGSQAIRSDGLNRLGHSRPFNDG